MLSNSRIEFSKWKAHQVLARPISGNARGQQDDASPEWSPLHTLLQTACNMRRCIPCMMGVHATVNEHATRSLTFGVLDGILTFLSTWVLIAGEVEVWLTVPPGLAG